MNFFQDIAIHISFCFTLYLWHYFKVLYPVHTGPCILCVSCNTKTWILFMFRPSSCRTSASSLVCLYVVLCVQYIFCIIRTLYILCCANIMYLVLYVYHTYVIRTLSTCRLSFVCAIFSCYVAWYFIVFQRLPATNETDNACNCGAI